MHYLKSTFNINVEKFFLYLEPDSFLFFGRSGAFKSMLLSFFNFVYKKNILTFSLSLIGNINKLLKFNIGCLSIQNMSIINNMYVSNCIPFYNWFGYRLHAHKYMFFLKTLLLQIFFSVTRGWIKRLRLVGIGYKLYNINNVLLFKIGYNKFIIFLLPLDLRVIITGRKKRGFTVIGINKLLLFLISKLLLQLRIPNIYTGKGIRLRGIPFVRKVGKKSLF